MYFGLCLTVDMECCLDSPPPAYSASAISVAGVTMGKSISHFIHQLRHDDGQESLTSPVEDTNTEDGKTEDVSQFPYVEFTGRDSVTCPTCQGTGRIPRGKTTTTLYLNPLVKPRRGWGEVFKVC